MGAPLLMLVTVVPRLPRRGDKSPRTGDRIPVTTDGGRLTPEHALTIAALAAVDRRPKMKIHKSEAVSPYLTARIMPRGKIGARLRSSFLRRFRAADDFGFDNIGRVLPMRRLSIPYEPKVAENSEHWDCEHPDVDTAAPTRLDCHTAIMLR